MPQQTQIYNGYEYTQQPDGSWRRGRAVGQGQIIADPTAQYEVPQAQAASREAIADATNAELTVQETQREMTERQQSELTASMRRAYQTQNVLASIREIRDIAREGGTGFESILASLPATRARELQSAVDTIKANLAFDRLQQMRDESETGGAVGNVTERELDLLGSTVASLDTGVGLSRFLERLDRVERNFLALPLTAAGIDPLSDQGRVAMREAGYTGVFDDETPGQNGDLAGSGDTTVRSDIPDEYQREHLRYLRDNWGNMDAGSYARFRAGLDEQYGLQPDLAGYREAVTNFNALAAQGGTPESLGGVPAPTRERGAIERGLNWAVETAPGTFFANMGNAGSLGLAGALSGNQEALALQREVRPYSSALGEMAGGVTGSMATGGAMGMLPVAGRFGNALRNPVVTDAVYGSVYGATQDTEDPLRGAMWGGGSSVVGGVIGQRIGDALPNVFAPNAVNQADEAVPTSQELRDIANQQYQDVMLSGRTAMPNDTTNFANMMNRQLQGSGRVGPQSGSYIGMTETPLRQARDLVNEFSGQTMTPVQAQTVRRSLSEATISGSQADRAIASRMLRDFDNWSSSVLPGIDVPNATSQRYLQGDQIRRTIDRGVARGERNLTGTPASGLRTQFGQLDDAITRGDAYFTPDVAQQVSRTARGDILTNSLRNVGEIGRTNPFTAVGAPSLAGAAGYAAGLGPLPSAALGLGTAGLGYAARQGANSRTSRAALEAELLALGGDAYRQALDEARRASGRRAGQVVGGLFGSGASMATR